MASTHALDSTTFRAPALGLLATEPLRAPLDYCAARVAPLPELVGDGHPVIVYPGLGGGALSTWHLRRFLKGCGFAVHGGKVSLIGWSLGGVYAREIAKRSPSHVRQVITLATPFAALAEGNHAGTVFKLRNGGKARLPSDLEARLRECPPVPTTSIYSRSDGIVSWRGCIEKATPTSESIEVDGSHLGMVTQPQVLHVVANRLAQPEGRWRPLNRPSSPRR